MPKPKSIYIPSKTKRYKGLHVYCGARECGTIIDTGICKQTGKPVATTCPHKNMHRYKAILYLPGTTSRKTKILQSTQYEDAIKETIAFRNEIRGGKNSGEDIYPQDFSEVTPQENLRTEEKTKPHSLISLMAKYVNFIGGSQDVPVFRRRARSSGHRGDVSRIFLRLITALKKRGHDPTKMRVDQIDDVIIGEFLEYISNDLGLGSSAYNRALTIMVSFYSHLIETENYKIRNPFLGIIRKPTKQNNAITIEKNEFEKLCELMQHPELGIRVLSNGVRKNYFKSWMPDAVSLGLFSGRRRTECTLMKWSQIFYKDGIGQWIAVPDYKIIRAKNLPQENWVYRYVPITKQLGNLLKKLGEDQYRNSDNYILAPHESMSRSSMASFISKSFAHYAEQLNPKTKNRLTYGSLRRTNFSFLAREVGIDNAQAISGHSGSDVLKKFYINKRVLVQTAKNFNVYDSEKKGDQEIESGKNNKGKGDISIER